VQSLAAQIKVNEKNVFQSGMVKLCEQLAEKLEKAEPGVKDVYKSNLYNVRKQEGLNLAKGQTSPPPPPKHEEHHQPGGHR